MNNYTSFYLQYNNQTYPLCYTYISNLSKFILYIPYPEDYLKNFKSHPIHQQIGKLFSMSFHIDKNNIFIESFYLYPVVYCDMISREELKSVKGLGKTMFFISLQHVKKYYFDDNITNVWIKLNATTEPDRLPYLIQYYRETYGLEPETMLLPGDESIPMKALFRVVISKNILT